MAAAPTSKVVEPIGPIQLSPANKEKQPDTAGVMTPPGVTVAGGLAGVGAGALLCTGALEDVAVTGVAAGALLCTASGGDFGSGTTGIVARIPVGPLIPVPNAPPDTSEYPPPICAAFTDAI